MLIHLTFRGLKCPHTSRELITFRSCPRHGLRQAAEPDATRAQGGYPAGAADASPPSENQPAPAFADRTKATASPKRRAWQILEGVGAAFRLGSADTVLRVNKSRVLLIVLCGSRKYA